ncbi:MAG: DUF4258 domain-containing protein [Anaerolineae bacterium]|nr:DUF4258 domain-containing protein [Anaerolineae bacterium]
MVHFFLSNHASTRSAQRNLSDDDIAFILQHGSRVHRTGVIFCQLRQKDLPPDTPGNHRHRQLAGTTVVTCRCGHTVITVYRDKRAFQRDTRKARYNHADLQCEACCAAAQPRRLAQTIAIGSAW